MKSEQILLLTRLISSALQSITKRKKWNNLRIIRRGTYISLFIKFMMMLHHSGFLPSTPESKEPKKAAFVFSMRMKYA
jgi:hypothetical protein